ncbi:MAG TPA: M1 family aminopeptidase [Candidatus Angelobacter sp.]|nr:M1 family aminopeptidase [Candidatus Angelobacter sp.]
MRRVWIQRVTKVLLPGFITITAAGAITTTAAGAQGAAGAQTAATSAPQGPTAQPAASGAVALFRELLNPAFDPKDVYTIREVSILREDLHISISDGTMALMRATNGQVTGAVFEGVGEVLLVPPNRAERTSLALYTGSAVLEQRFQSAYLRFADDALAEELRAGFRGRAQLDEAQEFIARWQEPARQLARADALPILEGLTSARSHDSHAAEPKPGSSGAPVSQFLHVRIGGTQVGIVDLFFDTNVAEQISVAQAGITNNAAYYDTWTSFPMRSVRQAAGEEDPATRAAFEMSDYVLRVKVQPPSDLSGEAEFTLTPRRSGQRTVVLELSRYLKLTEVRVNGAPVEFIQNEAMSGSELARRGDDLIGVVLSEPLQKDKPVRLAFKYSGPVMFNAGNELIYVGSRGIWYPNVGPVFSNFDITFECPTDWSVVATGKQVATSVAGGKRTTRFVTDKPISRAGFNLGKFVTAAARAGAVDIHAYGARSVEQSLAGAEARAGRKPEPAREAQQIADQAAKTVEYLSAQLDPFPYTNLEITQLPGLLSQSWPGLVYLSSTAFLTPDERRALGIRDPYVELLLSRLMLSHETAHQWWGDAVDWVSYRDEWIVEALANYCALMMLEQQHPGDMKTALDWYRGELLRETKNGIIADAGPVTLGRRLASSKFPDAYERVLYGRGTWLIHMLRTMLREAAPARAGEPAGGKETNDALFFAALKGLLAASPSHKLSTLDLQRAFEQVMPPALNYEGRKSLDWFFDSWINGNSVPRFSLLKVRMTPAGGNLKVNGTLLQDHAAQDMVTAIPIYAVDAAGKAEFLGFVFADDAKTEFTLTAPTGTKAIVMDPEETVLRR